MGRRRGAPKEKSRKKVTVKLLERLHAGKITQPYRIMEELIQQHHSHLRDAKLAIAWRFGWKADADGRVKLGQCKKGSDLDRELHDKDFVILLNHEAWNRSDFSEAQMRALIDHELCHAQTALDSSGQTKTDENGRTVYHRFPDTWFNTLDRLQPPGNEYIVALGRATEADVRAAIRAAVKGDA